MLHWHFSFKQKTELPAMGIYCANCKLCWNAWDCSLGEQILTGVWEEIWWPKWCRCTSPKKAPCTVWVTACFILVYNVCLCSFSSSPALGDIHLAALFSWGHIRTVYFGFYRNSASLSHCTFICSSDNSKDQQRCSWYCSDNLLSCGKEKNSICFSFFFVDLYFMDLMDNQNHNIW